MIMPVWSFRAGDGGNHGDLLGVQFWRRAWARALFDRGLLRPMSGRSPRLDKFRERPSPRPACAECGPGLFCEPCARRAGWCRKNRTRQVREGCKRGRLCRSPVVDHGQTSFI